MRLKAGLFPLTLLELKPCHIQQLEAELIQKSKEAPSFFQDSAVVLELSGSGDTATERDEFPVLSDIIALCRQYGLIAQALRGGPDELHDQAKQLGLALLPEGRKKPEPAAATPTMIAQASKVITTPVRSGQQVYAAGGDLIVLAQVSAGAEVLADGNIHIYGPLRGRALAGVKGDSTARVYCQSLEAELVSIAGVFTVDDDLHRQQWKQPAQIYLDQQQLRVEPLLAKNK